MSERITWEDFIYYGCMAAFLGMVITWGIR